MTSCMACPRKCGADRKGSQGFCGVGEEIKIARVGLHLWEEPCISYGKGSGTIFFSGCNLRCVYCQNHEISHGEVGTEISEERLELEILKLQEEGAANINLVTPTHYAEAICRVLQKVRPCLKIPVVYNSSGYERIETLRKLEGLIDIYLPDLKYLDSQRSLRYSAAEDYFTVASEALREMIRQCGYPVFDQDGRMKRGVLVRHLVLPGGYHDSIALLQWIAQNFDPQRMAISLMSQYFPTYRAKEFKEINRRLTGFEYHKVVEEAHKLAFSVGFIQDRSAATEEYLPKFDYTAE